MRVVLAVAMTLALLTVACTRQPQTPALVEYHDPETGFTIRHPQGWPMTTAGPEARFAPADPQSVGEFVSIFTVPVSREPSEMEIRRQVFGLLPIYGVSGFQQDPRTTPQTLWFKFEVTGSTGGVEWASVGVAAAGKARLQIAVCAKPLRRYREGQKQCDEIIRSFRPGTLSPE